MCRTALGRSRRLTSTFSGSGNSRRVSHSERLERALRTAASRLSQRCALARRDGAGWLSRSNFLQTWTTSPTHDRVVDGCESLGAVNLRVLVSGEGLDAAHNHVDRWWSDGDGATARRYNAGVSLGEDTCCQVETFPRLVDIAFVLYTMMRAGRPSGSAQVDRFAKDLDAATETAIGNCRRISDGPRRQCGVRNDNDGCIRT